MINLIKRFWRKTQIEGDCIIYTGSVDGTNYGKLTRNKKNVPAHRWIYEQSIGLVGNKDLRHSCDNPRCVKLQHLEPGTRSQNMQEASKRGRIVNQWGKC